MPKRILHVVTHMNRGGLETMIMNYYRHIDRSKVQFDFLVHREQKADYDDEILSMGGKIYRLQPLNPFSGSYRRSLDGFFAEHKEYEIVHSHLDCMAGIPLKYAKKHAVAHSVAHAHSSNQTKDAKYLLKLFYKHQITRYADHLFACGDQAGKWMFGKANFTVLNNAIDAVAYRYDPVVGQQVRQELGIDENALVVGHVGNFTPPKNHSFVLEVFAEILKNRPDARLLLVGDGQLRRQIEEQARLSGIEQAVVFAGLRRDVPRVLQAMDVFVFPSLFEGFGIVALEAQAAGLPCLISDKVPLECQKTDLVCQLPLTESPEVWAQAVLAAATQPRKDKTEAVRKSGFDIRENALWLQEFYLNQ